MDEYLCDRLLVSQKMTTAKDWPAIPFSEWQTTAAALHLYLQIVGKYRLAHTPWVNHSWHATLYPSPRGLTTAQEVFYVTSI